MTFEALIDRIYTSGKVKDAEEKEYPAIKNSISKDEGEFIQQLIETNDIKRTIEVGCAYGLSSLFICKGLKNKDSKHHVIVDPYQSTQWKNIGVQHLQQIGFDYFQLIEEKSEIALPRLLSEGNTFDIGFIDGWHTFDHTLIDFFYLDRMLSINGIIIIDDVIFPSINKLMGYVSQYPNYEVVGSVEIFSYYRALEKVLTFPFRVLSFFIPFSISSRIFSGNIAIKRKLFKLNTTMIALKKIKEDTRSYTWFKQF